MPPTMSTDPLRASHRTQVDPWFAWANQNLDEAEKWFDLHLRTCRDSLQDMARCCLSACDVRDMPGALSWQNSAFKPFAERSAEYGARLMGLAAGSGREWSRSFENQWQVLARQMNGGAGEQPRAAMEGPEAAFDYLRNSMQAFDAVWASARRQTEQSWQTAAQATPVHKPVAGKPPVKVK